MAQIEKFIIRLRWKVYWFKNPQQGDVERKETYGFNPASKPPWDIDIRDFEEDLIRMVSEIEMKSFDNPLQARMKKDLTRINSSKKMIVSADKTSNLYMMEVEDYKKLHTKEIQKEYKVARENQAVRINCEAAKIVRRMDLDDRVEAMAMKKSFLTIKDHKPDWPRKIHTRLINPCKSNLGIISKSFLDRINHEVRQSIKLAQWKNTKQVVEWFNGLMNKERLRFVKWDINNFYPSISEELLNKALAYAETLTYVSAEEREIIFHCRKCLLVDSEGREWVKSMDSNFDVTMGAGDGAEVCELVGIFLMSKLEEENIFDEGEGGIYRDDCLGAIRGGGVRAEAASKKIHRVFNKEGLKVTMEAHSKKVDFLDVILDLSTEVHQPYSKPEAILSYVSTQSSHPASILKAIPAGIAARLSSNSSSKEVFEKEVEVYNEALHQAGYDEELKYREDSSITKKCRRRRNILWFNPPWSSNVRTDVGRKFLSMIRHHFPKHSSLHSLINTKTTKISYSTCPNVSYYIKAHNSKLLRDDEESMRYGCNCRGGVEKCPLRGECLTPAVVYKAEVVEMVKGMEEKKRYFGLTAGEFKDRWRNHLTDFKYPSKRTSTRLARHIWGIKDRAMDSNLVPNIKWQIVSTHQPYQRGGRKCNLCLAEKTLIAKDVEDNLLNKRSEIANKCLHKLKHKLSQFLYILIPPTGGGGEGLEAGELQQADEEDQGGDGWLGGGGPDHPTQQIVGSAGGEECEGPYEHPQHGVDSGGAEGGGGPDEPPQYDGEGEGGGGGQEELPQADVDTGQRRKLRAPKVDYSQFF